MAETQSNDTLMALLALDAADSSDASAVATPGEAERRLPDLAERVSMFARALHGPEATVNAAMLAQAREHVLAAMAADLVDETTGIAAAADEVSPAQLSLATNSGVERTRFSRLSAETLQGLTAILAALFAVPVLRMALVPLAAIVVVGSVLTGNYLGTEGPASPPNAPTDAAPRLRGLAPAQPVDSAAERNLQSEIAAEGAKHGQSAAALARKLVDLASLYRQDGRYAEAEALCVRALGIQQPLVGARSPDTERTLRELALIYRAEGRDRDADALVEQFGPR